MSLRARLTLLQAALLVGCTALLLGVSWWLLGRHLDRTLPEVYADAVMARVGAQYVLGVVGVTLLALGLGWLVATRALAPLRAISASAREVGDASTGSRVPVGRSQDEIRELAETLNAMLERLEASAQGQRRFVANASHELRTPLTVIRTEAEVTLDDPRATTQELRDMGRAVLETTERMEGLLDGLLVLAAGEGGLRQRRPVDLADIARRALAETPGLDCEAAIEPATVSGDEALLGRLVANLLENAARHNRPGGRSWLAVGSDGAAATIRVANDGPAIDPADVPGLTDPFRRLNRLEGGHGLGLSIVRAVAEAHGGELRLRARSAAEGGGLEVEVALPPSRAGALTPA